MRVTELKFLWKPTADPKQYVASDGGYDLRVFPAKKGMFSYTVKYAGTEVASTTVKDYETARKRAEQQAESHHRLSQNNHNG